MKLSRRFRIEGRVQGVWFRASSKRFAEPLGITGHAINLPDGAVDVLAYGTADALESFHDWLKTGPALARVERVLELETEAASSDKTPVSDGFRVG